MVSVTVRVPGTKEKSWTNPLKISLYLSNSNCIIVKGKSPEKLTVAEPSSSKDLLSVSVYILVLQDINRLACFLH